MPRWPRSIAPSHSWRRRSPSTSAAPCAERTPAAPGRRRAGVVAGGDAHRRPRAAGAGGRMRSRGGCGAADAYRVPGRRTDRDGRRREATRGVRPRRGGERALPLRPGRRRPRREYGPRVRQARGHHLGRQALAPALPPLGSVAARPRLLGADPRLRLGSGENRERETHADTHDRDAAAGEAGAAKRGTLDRTDVRRTACASRRWFHPSVARTESVAPASPAATCRWCVAPSVPLLFPEATRDAVSGRSLGAERGERALLDLGRA